MYIPKRINFIKANAVKPSLILSKYRFYTLNSAYSCLINANSPCVRHFATTSKFPPLFGSKPRIPLSTKLGLVICSSASVYIAYKITKECFCESPLAPSCKINSQYKKILAGKVEDFENGGVYEIKIEGNFYSIYALCPHFGAEFLEGSSSDEVVVCPWHNAKYKIKTGECVTGPIIDNIPTYPVDVQDGNVYITVPKDIHPTCPSQKSCKIGHDKTFIIIGGGAAAYSAVKTLRDEGFCGKIKMYSSDSYPPYYRPALSKAMTTDDPDKLFNEQTLINPDFYKNNDIEFFPNTVVDTSAKNIQLNDGTKVNFDKILIATGVEAAKLRISSREQAKNIFTLKKLTDATDIAKLAKKGKRVLIIGANFIGCELASTLSGLGALVTVVTDMEYPMENIFGRRIGSAILSLYKQSNVKFMPKSLVKNYIINGNVCKAVELANGEKVAADIVVEGVGSVPVRPSIDDQKSGFIKVDSLQRVNGNPDVYAAGDIVEFPYFLTGDYINVQHWNLATDHGRIAAKNMLGKVVTYTEVPFFWSNMFRKNMRFSGYIKDFDDVIIEGDLQDLVFVAYYLKGQRVMATLSMGNDAFSSVTGEAFKNGLMPTKAELVLGAKNSKDVIKDIEVRESYYTEQKKITLNQ